MDWSLALGHVHRKTLAQALKKSNGDGAQAPGASISILCIVSRRLTLICALTLKNAYEFYGNWLNCPGFFPSAPS
jgi:hypothetical protein